jgi:polysaccharide deacetylase 2 family uncharacterized protein YibQ
MDSSGGFWRDYLRAAVIAVPLAGVLAWGWTEFQASQAAATQQTVPQTAAIVAPPEPSPEPQIAAPAEPVREPAGPFFGIRREGVVAAPAPVPARPVAVANDGGWESRAIPAPAIRTGAYVAIIIDDMGMDRARAARLAALPGPLTFSYLAYAPDIDAQSRGARANGHEIMLHLPMEPEGRDDPGPGALRISLTDDEIRARTAASLDRLPLAVGLNNHMGSKFTRDLRAMRPVLAELASRGLLFVDSRTSGSSVGLDVAKQSGVAAAGRDVFLDNEIDARAIRVQLAELERVASRRGSAIAIGHPHEATIEALAQFLPGMQARGLQLVAASAIVRQRLRETPAPSAPLVALEIPAPVSRNIQEVATAAAPVVRQTARAVPESSAPVWNGGEVPWKRYPIE